MLAAPKLLKFFHIFPQKYQEKKDSNKADSILIAKYFEKTQNA